MTSTRMAAVALVGILGGCQQVTLPDGRVGYSLSPANLLAPAAATSPAAPSLQAASDPYVQQVVPTQAIVAADRRFYEIGLFNLPAVLDRCAANAAHGAGDVPQCWALDMHGLIVNVSEMNVRHLPGVPASIRLRPNAVGTSTPQLWGCPPTVTSPWRTALSSAFWPWRTRRADRDRGSPGHLSRLESRESRRERRERSCIGSKLDPFDPRKQLERFVIDRNDPVLQLVPPLLHFLATHLQNLSGFGAMRCPLRATQFPHRVTRFPSWVTRILSWPDTGRRLAISARTPPTCLVEPGSEAKGTGDVATVLQRLPTRSAP